MRQAIAHPDAADPQRSVAIDECDRGARHVLALEDLRDALAELVDAARGVGNRERLRRARWFVAQRRGMRSVQRCEADHDQDCESYTSAVHALTLQRSSGRANDRSRSRRAHKRQGGPTFAALCCLTAGRLRHVLERWRATRAAVPIGAMRAIMAPQPVRIPGTPTLALVHGRAAASATDADAMVCDRNSRLAAMHPRLDMACSRPTAQPPTTPWRGSQPGAIERTFGPDILAE
ncbi:MAG TPA: hypothetical protein VFK02_18280 [Kofleriaceae bacterium]|nr:hypothetical protein [Kofleriaceae bacterium]